jgi:hypothetical protein
MVRLIFPEVGKRVRGDYEGQLHLDLSVGVAIPGSVVCGPRANLPDLGDSTCFRTVLLPPFPEPPPEGLQHLIHSTRKRKPYAVASHSRREPLPVLLRRTSRNRSFESTQNSLLQCGAHHEISEVVRTQRRQWRKPARVPPSGLHEWNILQDHYWTHLNERPHIAVLRPTCLHDVARLGDDCDVLRLDAGEAQVGPTQSVALLREWVGPVSQPPEQSRPNDVPLSPLLHRCVYGGNDFCNWPPRVLHPSSPLPKRDVGKIVGADRLTRHPDANDGLVGPQRRPLGSETLPGSVRFSY